MAGLLDRPDTTTPEAPQAQAAPAPEAPRPEAPARTCTTCSAPLDDGQDWCLECGSAQPGRLGGRPGWRAALTVLAVTGVLVGGAAAAAYAALSSDAQSTVVTTAAPPPAVTPQTTPPPVVTPPAQTTATTPSTATPTVKAPKTPTATVPKPVQTPSTPPSSSSTPSTPSSGSSGSAGSGTSTTSTTQTTPSEPVAIDLASDAAALYDPFKRVPAAQASDPADAIDGKATTDFTLPVASDGTVRAGLTLSLAKARKLKELVITADTPGFTVEVYATKSATIPPDILDARWTHVTSRTDADVEEKVRLDATYRHVLLWFTEQPADTKVAIPEVQLFSTDQ